MNDIIICRLDNKEITIKHLSRHLKLHHQKDYKEYIKEHIDDFKCCGWNLCSICGNPVKGKACRGECIKQHYSKIRKGKSTGPMSKETKQKLSENRKQKYMNGWNPRIGKLHTEESKKKISNIQTKRLSDPMNHPFYGEHHTKKTKEKMSKSHIGLLTGEKNGMFGKTHTPETIEKIFKHRKMNKLEEIVANELNKANILYHFQYFINECGICKSYDFKIKGKPLILEIDGDFWHGNPNHSQHYIKVNEIKKNDKIKEEIALKRGIKVIRLWESDIKKDPSIVLRTIRPHIY
jgi:very-short-patch-repair endonuclease